MIYNIMKKALLLVNYHTLAQVKCKEYTKTEADCFQHNTLYFILFSARHKSDIQSNLNLNGLLTNPGRFGPGSFRPESFRPGSFRPILGVGLSALEGGSFRPFFWVSRFGPESFRPKFFR